MTSYLVQVGIDGDAHEEFELAHKAIEGSDL